jgi:hypothetical protein
MYIFKNLGLLVIDEEQKFGVQAKREDPFYESQCRYTYFDGDAYTADVAVFIDGSP